VAAGAGYPNPVIEAVTSARESSPVARRSTPDIDGDADLPADWQLVRELPSQTYTWPRYKEHYDK
jgi:hypothetical protein